MRSKLGQPVAVLCARYWYRGIVTRVSDDCLMLSNPYAIEVTGISTGESPTREDVIPSDLMVALQAIEICSQPTWCFAGYENLKSVNQKEKKNV